MDTQRARILNRLRAIKRDVEQQFTDAASWNENSAARAAGATPIDPDPSGELRALVNAIDELLRNDPGVGPIAQLKFERHH